MEHVRSKTKLLFEGKTKKKKKLETKILFICVKALNKIFLLLIRVNLWNLDGIQMQIFPIIYFQFATFVNGLVDTPK